MKCENCNQSHDGSYGSGRFCSQRYSRSFSTKLKREEINKKVSSTMKGRSTADNSRNTYKYTFTNSDRKKAEETRAKKLRQRILKKLNNGEYIKSGTLRPILLEEQENKCFVCGIENIWNNQRLVFVVDHIDGNPSNNTRENLRAICPNCNSQTPTFAGRNMGSRNSFTSREYMRKYPDYRKKKMVG